MKAQIISFDCLLKNKAGKVISTTFNRDVLTTEEGIGDAVLGGLVRGLQNLKAGESRTIALKAEEAYGLYDPQKVILFPRKKLPKTLRPDDSISIVSNTGKVHVYRVLSIHDDMVSLDGNHPLAGQDLIFEIHTISVRDATAEEIESSLSFVSVPQLH